MPRSIRRGPVVVVGSLNMDLVVRTPRLPRPGETVAAHGFGRFPGGKGANQAVAAARMGARVAMVGRVGRDPFGTALREALAAEGIDLAWLQQTDGVETGVASIWVDDAGANAIAIVPGANRRLGPADIAAAREAIAGASVVLAQLEIPPETVEALLEVAGRAGVPVILDPAPIHPRAAGWLGRVWAVAPNQVEAAALVGFAVESVADGARACRALLEAGVEVAVVKMGGQGVVVAERGAREARHIPAVPVQAVDTTAAGDAFCGALAAALAEGLPLLEACQLANAAAGLSTTRPGAQPSLPRRAEVDAFMREHPGRPPVVVPLG